MTDLLQKNIGNPVTVGRHTYVSYPNDWNKSSLDVRFWNSGGKLTIGSFCSIADRVSVFVGGNHNFNLISACPFHKLTGDYSSAAHEQSNGDIVIGNDVWIGSRVMILSGVTIGDGACIGACSVVTRNIPPYEVWAGNPAHMLRKRFTYDEIRMLEELKWWNWSDEKIKDVIPLLQSSNVEGLYNYWMKEKRNNDGAGYLKTA